MIPTGSDLNYNHHNSESPKGKQRPIACFSWTTATGKVIPVMFKIQDGDGVIQTIDRIHVTLSEKRYYCGIPAYEYQCTVIVNGLNVNLTLQYYPETCRWYLLEQQPESIHG